LNIVGGHISVMQYQLTTNFQHFKRLEWSSANPSPLEGEGYEALPLLAARCSWLRGGEPKARAAVGPPRLDA
jgi:hypothetical protein